MTSDDSARVPDAPVVASVLPLIPAWRVDHLFDYLVAPDQVDRVHAGSLVRVPFGNRRVRAIVIHTKRERDEPCGGSVPDLEVVIAPVLTGRSSRNRSSPSSSGSQNGTPRSPVTCSRARSLRA